MLNFNVKLIIFILEALLVVLAIVVFSYLDPWNIFNSKKITLKDTPAMVKSIQGIGQLITAEYYGEVLRSSGEELKISTDNMKQDDKDRLLKVLDDVSDALIDLKYTYDSLNKKLKNRRQVFREFKKRSSSIVNSPDYDDMLKIVDKNYDLSEKELLYYFYDEENADLDDYAKKIKKAVYAVVVTNFIEEKYKNTPREERKIAKNSVILLGRGWVKVGFDFSNFDDQHFNYLSDRNLVRLTYHSPKIISATINPWFIPERKIKGFEYVYVGNRIDKTADSENAVKIIRDLKASCLNDLINDAREAGIMESAKEQAEISLAQLFSLLLGKNITVKIFSYPHDALLDDLTQHKTITPRDVGMIDSLVSRYHLEESEKTLAFLDTIHHGSATWKANLSPWPDADKNWEIVSRYHRIAADGVFTVQEHDALVGYIKNTTPTLKDYFYYALTDSLVYDELKIRPLTPENLSTATKTKVANSKKANLKMLWEKVKTLRTDLPAGQLAKEDSVMVPILE